MSHTTDGVDEVAAVKIFEPVLVWIVGVGATVKVYRRRVLTTLLITSILQEHSVHVGQRARRTYMVTLFVKHKGGNGPTGIGTITGLTTDMDSGVAPAVLVLSSGDGTSRHRHNEVSGSGDGEGDNRSG